MRILITILSLSVMLSSELEVDGNLKVTGTIENDSLAQVIANLEAQVQMLQSQLQLIANSNHGVNFITSNHDLIIPNGVNSIFVEAWGAGGRGFPGGGSSNWGLSGPSGGAGGYIRGYIQVQVGDSLNFLFESTYTSIYKNNQLVARVHKGEDGILNEFGGSGGDAFFIDSNAVIFDNLDGYDGGSQDCHGTEPGNAPFCVFGDYGDGGRGGRAGDDYCPNPTASFWGENGKPSAIYYQF
tara:strand:+ start:461 stop:1180 length:720 start_codon:yes stop_codon:yes gene_type:complete